MKTCASFPALSKIIEQFIHDVLLNKLVFL